MSLFVRLAAYKPYGDLIGVVSEPLEISKWYQRQGDIPQLQATWSPQQPLPPYLSEADGPIEVAVQTSVNGGEWREPRNGRFISAADTYERVNDKAQIHKVTYEGYVALLDTALVWNAGGSIEAGTDSNKRIFNNVSAGSIMYTLITEAKARGALSGLQLGFSGVRDSYGNLWSINVARSFEKTATLWQVLQSFQQAGELDFWISGRKLILVDPAKYDGYDRYSGDNPIYLRDQLVQGSPESLNWKDLANVALVAGKDGFGMSVLNLEAFAPWGKREVGVVASKIADVTAGDRYGRNELKHRENVTKTLTREWAHTDLTPWVPGTHFEVGDWCLADTSDGTRQRIKIVDANITVTKGTPKVFVTLGSIRDDAITRALKRQKAMDGTWTTTDVGRGSTSSPGADKRVPVAPPGCAVEAVTYLTQDGHYAGSASVRWSASAVDTMGESCSVTDYRVWMNCRNDTRGWQNITQVTGSQETTVGGLWIGYTYEFKVQAISGYGMVSGFSPVAVVKIDRDMEAPPAPSTPTVTSQLAGLTVAWDGLTYNGQTMPADLNYLNVYLTGRTGVQGKINPNADNRVTLFGLNPGDNYEAKLTAVDFAGNESAPSEGASVTVVSVLDGTDFAARMAKAAKWSDNLYPDPAFVDESLNVTRFTVDTGWALDRVSSPRRASTTVGNKLFLSPTGDITSDVGWSLNSSYMIEWTIRAGSSAIDTVVLAVSDVGSVDASTHATIPAGTTATVAKDVKYGAPYNNLHLCISVNGACSVEAVSVRKKVYSTIIEDGAVTTGKLYADKVMADTILGKTVVADFIKAGQIKSTMLATDALDFKSAKGLALTASNISTSEYATQGIWLRNSNNTLTAYSPSGAQTMKVDANTGNFTLGNGALTFDTASAKLSIVGDIQSGTTYPFTVIDNDKFPYSKNGIHLQMNANYFANIFTETSPIPRALYTGPIAYGQYTWPSWIGLDSNGRIQIATNQVDTRYQASLIEVSRTGIVLDPANRVLNMHLPTGSTSMTLSINSDWSVCYNGSLRAIKKDITPLTNYWSILDLTPVYYRDRAESEKALEKGRTEPGLLAGLIADDVAALAKTKPELKPLLTYMEDLETKELKLAGVAYDRVAAYLVPVVRELAERVKQLESR